MPQFVGASLPVPKLRGFDSWSGHIPRLQVQSPVGWGAYRRQPIGVALSRRGFCLLLCLPLSLIKSLKKHILRWGFKKKEALAGVVLLVGHCPTKRKVTSSIPGQGTCLVCGPFPVRVHARGNQSMLLSHTNDSLLLCLPPNPSF